MSSGSSGLSSIIAEWESLNKEYSDLEGLKKSYVKSVSEMKTLEEQCKKGVEKHFKGVTRILQSLKCYRSSSEEEKEKEREMKKAVVVRKQELKEMQSTLPKSNGLYLNIVLGSVNVTLLNQDEKYKYKDQYERFKLAVTVIILLLSVLNLIFLYSRTLDALLHFLLVWYYCTLTIRESILKVNGSRIKGWWRTHHFITTALAGVLILWPDGKTYHMFRKQFLWYSCYTSFLQFLQCYYQQGCLYRLRALGKRHNMDITIDGFHSWMWRGLQFLLPFLAIGYVWQLYNSYVLFKACMSSEICEWQVGASAAIFLILFVGNSLTTSLVVHQKLNLKELILRKLK